MAEEELQHYVDGNEERKEEAHPSQAQPSSPLEENVAKEEEFGIEQPNNVTNPEDEEEPPPPPEEYGNNKKEDEERQQKETATAPASSSRFTMFSNDMSWYYKAYIIIIEEPTFNYCDCCLILCCISFLPFGLLMIMLGIVRGAGNNVSYPPWAYMCGDIPKISDFDPYSTESIGNNGRHEVLPPACLEIDIKVATRYQDTKFVNLPPIPHRPLCLHGNSLINDLPAYCFEHDDNDENGAESQFWLWYAAICPTCGGNAWRMHSTVEFDNSSSWYKAKIG